MFDYVVEIDYEDEHSETVIIPAASECEAVEIAERDPEVKIARVHGTTESV